MGFPLALKLMTLNDLEQRNDRYFATFNPKWSQLHYIYWSCTKSVCNMCNWKIPVFGVI